MDYQTFIANKAITVQAAGFVVDESAINPQLFPFQRDIVRWTLTRGRAALFADCGLGKTPMQLEWAKHVAAHTGLPVLILAPLAVAQQTKREGEKFGISVTICRSQDDVSNGVNVANYEMLEHFESGEFGGIVLDESSILKAYDGKTRTMIIDTFAQTPYRLACTATPAPNDHMELGNHAEFLGVMSRVEMLSMFFVHDGGDTSKWRLKGHAEDKFWKWVASWACLLRKPSDLGYPDEGFDLPPITFHHHVVEGKAADGYLFPVEALNLMERREARKASLQPRVDVAAELVNGSDEPWIVWCDLNAESEMLAKSIADACEVTGSMDHDEKARRLLAFAANDERVLVTKGSIAGFGMNFQHCAKVALVGLSDSYEQFYQQIRRCWRFGQTRPVEVHIITSECEGAVVANIKRKEEDAQKMYDGMIEHTAQFVRENVHGGTERETAQYRESVATGKGWALHLGDCVEALSRMDSDSIHYSIFSPPFASLYTYSNSDRDMGNCKDADEFMKHFWFLTAELHRVMMPGRLVSFHCMNLPTTKQRDGFIGIRDFRGELIRMFEDAGFVFHSEVCIWKDPVTAMQRTKAIGLLYKQLRKDSALSRQGIPDYLVTMRKLGDNPEPITKTHEGFPVGLWQNYASPVWMDINPSDTLQRESAREEKDERHICPLQLEVIRRGIKLWSNPGDTVLSPFAGIGSEGYVAIEEGRQFVGAELKESYWQQACANLRRAVELSSMPTLFDMEEVSNA